jgi:hypothetical protein
MASLADINGIAWDAFAHTLSEHGLNVGEDVYWNGTGTHCLLSVKH